MKLYLAEKMVDNRENRSWFLFKDKRFFVEVIVMV